MEFSPIGFQYIPFPTQIRFASFVASYRCFTRLRRQAEDEEAVKIIEVQLLAVSLWCHQTWHWNIIGLMYIIWDNKNNMMGMGISVGDESQ